MTRENAIFFLFALPFLICAAISGIYQQVLLMAIFLFGLIFASIPFGAFVMLERTK